jgi:hypothetical protein
VSSASTLPPARPSACVLGRLDHPHPQNPAHRRGINHPDFLVIEPEVENAARESVRLRRTLDGMLVAADIIVVSEQRVREWRDVYGNVIHTALSEGRQLAA